MTYGHCGVFRQAHKGYRLAYDIGAPYDNHLFAIQAAVDGF
jgi:hypothetical protein